MKIIIISLAIITSTLALASTPDSMYVHFTGAKGDSIVVHAIVDVDSIVYYAPPIPATGTFTDNRDGNTYNWITIGEQVWMAENLRATKYSNGTPILKIKANIDWAKLGDNNTDKAYCWQNNDSITFASSYGALYTFAATVNGIPNNGSSYTQGICPEGWHIPNNSEWQELSSFISSDGHQDEDGRALMSNTDWTEINDKTGGTNDYGFNALPSGNRIYGNGEYGMVTYGCVWWSSTDNTGVFDNIKDEAVFASLNYSSDILTHSQYYKSNGYSVRCVKN